jgi:DNA/RNA endonuclease YhcR with UshA esterase domain
MAPFQMNRKITQATPLEPKPSNLASTPDGAPGPIENPAPDILTGSQIGAPAGDQVTKTPEAVAKVRGKQAGPVIPEGGPVEPKVAELGQFHADHLSRLQQAAANQGGIRVVVPDGSTRVINLPTKKGK